MADSSFGIQNANATLIHDASYRDIVARLVQTAAHHCLCMVFIVNPDPVEDTDLLVDGLLHDLAAATWRGVDARLLVGGSRSNGSILDAALLARERAQSLGIDCRLGAAVEQRSNHSKLVIADERCLLGSHNWSPGSLTDQTQDSVFVDDAALAAYFVSRFEKQWRTARQEGFDVPR